MIVIITGEKQSPTLLRRLRTKHKCTDQGACIIKVAMSNTAMAASKIFVGLLIAGLKTKHNWFRVEKFNEPNLNRM